MGVGQRLIPDVDKTKESWNTYTHLCNMTHSKDIMAKVCTHKPQLLHSHIEFMQVHKLNYQSNQMPLEECSLLQNVASAFFVHNNTHVALAALFVNTSACTSYPSYSHINSIHSS